MSGIKDVSKKENMCIIALVMFYDNITTNPMKLFRVLGFVVYSVIENYVFIEYLGCQSKYLSLICFDNIFADRNYNELLGIGITEDVMNLI